MWKKVFNKPNSVRINFRFYIKSQLSVEGDAVSVLGLGWKWNNVDVKESIVQGLFMYVCILWWRDLSYWLYIAVGLLLLGIISSIKVA